MDPLVRVAVRTQRVLARSFGSSVAVFGAALLVLTHMYGLGSWLRTLVVISLAGSVLWRVHQRYRVLNPLSPARREAEIGMHLAVLTFALLEQLPGGLEGPFHALVYVLAMWAAGFLCRRAMTATITLAVALEVALSMVATDLEADAISTRVALLGVFAGLNLVVFRAEIARVRRLSRQKVDSELSKMREAARSYRLRDVGRSSVESSEDRDSDPDQLVHSSVDHLHLSLRFMLGLLRRTCGLQTAALLWLDDDGSKLHLREVSSAVDELKPGPFPAKEGLFAAALEAQHPVTLSGSRARARMPLYDNENETECVCAIPLMEANGAVGVLLVDLEPGRTLDDATKGTLIDASRFILRSVGNERSFLQLERTKTEQGKLYRAADMLSDARSEVEVIRAGVDSARLFAHFDFAAVTLFHKSRQAHEICAVSGEGADELVGTVFAHNAGLVSMVVQNKHPLPYRGRFQKSHMVFDEHLHMPDMPSLIILPLMVHDTALGSLLLGSRHAGAFSEEVRPLLEVLSRHVAVSLANARMMKRLEELATTDSMTGLLNKRALTEAARQKIRAAKRFNRPLSVIVGDIDFFKRVNDNFGHDIGDVVIKGFGEVLKQSKRETDSVGRFGGEEFVVVCEETDAAGAQLLAERIRQELEAVKFKTPQGPLSVTCSLGVATFPQAGDDWESLFKATDEALYGSKQAGRNRVTVWSPALRGAAA